jgi:isopenicillin-N epimerase
VTREHWTLDPRVAFLNHGSFGATPRVVLERQSELRARMEREPIQFFLREGPGLWHEALERVAAFLHAPVDELAFVRNATEGVNAVLRSLPFEPGDRILLADHGYPAVRYAARFVAERTGADLDVVSLPFFEGLTPSAVVERVLGALEERTKLLIVDHVTSPTGLVLPVAELADEVQGRGVDVLVDGAHAPVMVDLDLSALGAAYYTGNFHKWACAPKGAGFLYVRADRREGIVPPSISHGYRPELCPADRFRAMFDWTGTSDPTAMLCVPFALDTLERIGGGFDAIRERNRALVLEGRALVAEALGVEPTVPESMVGFLAALPIPDGEGDPPESGLHLDPLQLRLFDRHRVEVPIFPWPHWPRRMLRISAHLHNERADYERLAAALRAEL